MAWRQSLMPEMPHASEYHGQVTLISGGNNVLITD
tara:strand:+ start:610 stop:714 length:105 start_codon:yes stop_codon:yes gene_type:complete